MSWPSPWSTRERTFTVGKSWHLVLFTLFRDLHFRKRGSRFRCTCSEAESSLFGTTIHWHGECMPCSLTTRHRDVKHSNSNVWCCVTGSCPSGPNNGVMCVATYDTNGVTQVFARACLEQHIANCVCRHYCDVTRCTTSVRTPHDPRTCIL
jgi:hypothetical protein